MKQIDVLNIYIKHVRQDDGTYKDTLQWDGNVSNPAGANQEEKTPTAVRKIEKYDGAKLLSVVLTECIKAIKKEGGVA